MVFDRVVASTSAGAWFLAMAIVASPLQAQGQPAPGLLPVKVNAPATASGELVIGFESVDQCVAALMKFPLQILCIEQGLKNCRVKFHESSTAGGLSAFAAQVGALPGVTYVEPVYLALSPEGQGCGKPAIDVGAQQCTIAFADGTPTQSEFTLQEALASTGFTEAQALSKHYKHIVAVIDTGVDASHPALAGHLAGDGFDFIEEQPIAYDKPYGHDVDGDGYVDEAWGHGTHLSSLIALMNPDARILPARVLDSEGNGNAFDVARAIRWATDRGASIINLSLSVSAKSLTVAEAIEYAKAHDVRLIVSAGNTGKKKLLFPADYSAADFDFPPGTLLAGPFEGDLEAVASIDMFGVKAPFSAWGPAVELVAPGVGLYGAMPGGGYAWWSGTSMSTAVVTGVLSLLDSVGGKWSKLDTENVLGWTANSVDALNPAFAGYLGHGAPNAYKAALVLTKQDGWGGGGWN